MCGILVYFDKNKSRLQRYKNEELVNSDVHRRGPDYSLIKEIHSEYGSTVLVNSVLAIKTEKEMPIEISETRGDIKKEFLYNGESYMTEWADKVDTEELLKHTRFGTEYIYKYYQDYRGFFSIAAYINDSIHFSVDLLSEKQLFYYQDRDILVIASTIGIIIQLLNSINKKATLNIGKVEEYFSSRHLIQHKKTIWKEINRVLPGQVHSINLRTFKQYKQSIERSITQLYQYLRNMRTKQVLTKEIDNYIYQSIHDTEKNKGSFIISGGIDSTLVTLTSLDKLKYESLDTWTLKFGEKDAPANAVTAICESKKIENTSIEVSTERYKEATLSLYSFLQYPLPTHSFSSYDILVSEVNKNKTRILYGGEGADEIFGGYALYDAIKKITNESSSSTSLSPYSTIDRKYMLKTEQTDVDIAYRKFKQLLVQDGYLRADIRASILCDIFIQLPSTGLLCADNIGGKYGIESRSPLANIHTLALTILNINYVLPDQLTDGKQCLTNLLKSRLHNNNLLPEKKQGFSGYPNEIFTQEQTITNKEILCDLMPNLRSKVESCSESAVKWKINNMFTFLNSVGSI